MSRGRPRTVPFGPKPRPQKRGRKPKATPVTIVAAPRKAPSYGAYSGFPIKKKITLKYVEDVTLTQQGTSFNALYTFRANSIFDPNYTGTGHQPYGHDQWAQIYYHYQVMKTKMKVQAISPQGAAMTSNCIVGINLSSSAADIPTDKNLIRESGKGYKTLTPQKPLTVYATWNAKSVFPAAAPNQTAAFGANPAEDSFMTVYALCPSADLATNIYCSVTLTYYVMCWERKNLGTS